MALKPDGSGMPKVLGMSGGSNDLDLYLYRLRERELVRLTEDELCNVQPDFSPDGRRLVFCSGDNRTQRDAVIQVMRLEDKSVRMIGKGSCPDWAPAGEHIAFVLFHWKEVESKAETALVIGEDGRVRREPASGTHWTRAGAELRVVHAEGTDTETVARYDGLPLWTWGQKGQRLFWLEQDEEAKTVRMHCFDLANRQSEPFVEFPPSSQLTAQPSCIACSPDGRYLALTISRTGRDTVALVNRETRAIQYLENNSQVCEFESDLRDPKFSPSGKLSTSFGYDPWAIFVHARIDGKWQRTKEIWPREDGTGPGYWGNYAWLVVDGKEKMLVGYGQTDSKDDFFELHLLDAKTGRCERNLTEEIRAAWEATVDAEQQAPPE